MAVSIAHPAAPAGRTRLAGRTAQLSGEGALDVFTRARAREALGTPVAHLELGEPDFPTPAHVTDAALRALRDGDTRYTPPAGLPELREAIAEQARARGVPATAHDVLVTPGAKPALLYAALGVLEPGDEALVPDPGFPIYPSLARFAGATPVSYGLDAARGFAPDVDEIAARIGPRTRALFLNAPHNPTGGGADAGTLERIAELAERHDLTLIADEIYARIVYDGASRAPSIAAIPGLAARTIVIDGFSKAYAMTGWRLGFAILPSPLVERFTTLAVNGHTCTSAFVQRAGLAALLGPQDAVQAMVAEFASRREVITRGLADRLLEEFGVALLPGTAFGARGAGHLRLSFAAAPATIALALTRIHACLDTLATPRGSRS